MHYVQGFQEQVMATCKTNFFLVSYRQLLAFSCCWCVEIYQFPVYYVAYIYDTVQKFVITCYIYVFLLHEAYFNMDKVEFRHQIYYL